MNTYSLLNSDVSVGQLSAYSVTQGSTQSSVYITIQEGYVVIHLHGELDVEMYAVEVVKEVIFTVSLAVVLIEDILCGVDEVIHAFPEEAAVEI
jgi:hypothetical protein